MGSKHLKLPQEVAVSFYLGLIVVLEEASKPGSAFLGALGRPLSGWLYPFLVRITHNSNLHPGLFIHTVFLWIILGLIIFFALRTISMFGRVQRPVLAICAITTLAAFPVTWLRLGNLTNLDTPARTQLLWETIVVCACALMFFVRVWTPSAAIVACTVATTHFAIWFWVTRNALAAELRWVVLILGVFSAIASGQVFVSRKQIAALGTR